MRDPLAHTTICAEGVQRGNTGEPSAPFGSSPSHPPTAPPSRIPSPARREGAACASTGAWAAGRIRAAGAGRRGRIGREEGAGRGGAAPPGIGGCGPVRTMWEELCSTSLTSEASVPCPWSADAEPPAACPSALVGCGCSWDGFGWASLSAVPLGETGSSTGCRRRRGAQFGEVLRKNAAPGRESVPGSGELTVLGLRGEVGIAIFPSAFFPEATFFEYHACRRLFVTPSSIKSCATRARKASALRVCDHPVPLSARENRKRVKRASVVSRTRAQKSGGKGSSSPPPDVAMARIEAGDCRPREWRRRLARAEHRSARGRPPRPAPCPSPTPRFLHTQLRVEIWDSRTHRE